MDEHIYIETPLVYSVPMSRRFGRDVYVKMDALQPSGSFKIRGMELLMKRAAERGVKHFFCSSGGNAGVAAAYVASVIQKAITVVIPTSTPSYMAEKIASYGANVVVNGKVWAEADAHAKSLMKVYLAENGEASAVHVPPFDHEDLWEGHSTIIDEIIRQLPDAHGHRCNASSPASPADSKPAAIVVSVGGGGLLNGVCEGLAQSDWFDVPVVAAETEGAACFAASVKANNQPVRLSEITSLAVTLGASQVSQASRDWASQRIICPIIVSDAEAVNAAYAFGVDHRVLVEPSCGAALAATEIICDPDGNTECVAADNRWARHATISATGPIIVIACGGNMASPALMHSFASRVPGGLDAAEKCDVVPFFWRQTSGWGRLGEYLWGHRGSVTAVLAGLVAAGCFAAGSVWGRNRGMSDALSQLKYK